MKQPHSTGGKIRVGISGWTYKPWRGTFYPKGLVQKKELEYASSVLSSIEVNGTFYGLQRPQTFADWYQRTPETFVFSVKAPQFITHIRRLRDIQAPLANFLLSGLLVLSEKLGPILWQFPPSFQFAPDLFASFLAQLPRTTETAAKLAKNCDSRMAGRTWSTIDRDRPLRHAVEIRHASFATPEFIRLLRKFNVALVIADTGGKWPMLHDVTADFVYVRLHGVEELYASGYSETALDSWAAKIAAWSRGADAPGVQLIGPAAAKRKNRDVFVYFDNDVKVKSPVDAQRLAKKLGI